MEQQQAEAGDRRSSPRPVLSPTQQKRLRDRDGLLLIRTRLLHQIDLSTHPEHRRMLQQALAEIDTQLASFEQPQLPSTL